MSVRKRDDERKRLKRYKATVADIERIAHRGRPPVATGQTIARLREHPMERMFRNGDLYVWEQSAANEIRGAYCFSIGRPIDHDSALGICRETSADAADSAAVRRIDTLEKYQEWRSDLVGTAALAAVVAILIDERGFRETEHANGWRNGTAKDYLLTGLRHFAALRGNTPRGVKWRYVSTSR